MKDNDWSIPYCQPAVPPQLLAAGFSPLLSMALALRGVTTADEARKLLYGGEECLLDPMLISDMGKAVARIKDAILAKETVAVYGDYDVDGITSTCLLTDYLRFKGLQCVPYIPDRNEEGYGLNCAALDTLKEKGVSLLVTVDCGITAVVEAEHAKALGIDMVVTDHHECGADALPEAVALIDCKRSGDTYPNKDLAGVGVALKLVCACEGESGEMLSRYADLVAIGTVADVMPLTGENRFLVRLGLENISANPRPGIAAMLKETGMESRRLSATSIGFSLAPRLNAAGRLGQAALAMELLMCADKTKAAALASQLCELNRQRQSIETDIWQEANGFIAGTVPDVPIVLASETWNQGVIGIAASRLAEQYSLPTVMICLKGEVGKGSCRSFGGFNIYDALAACSQYLIGFGGHALAAGLNIRRDKLDEFRSALAAFYQDNRPSYVPQVRCDLLINTPELLCIDNVRSLDLLEPFGNGNAKPVMCMSGARLESVFEVGNGKHLRMKIRLASSCFDVIYFSHSLEDVNLTEGELIDLAFSPQINEYRGNMSVQLVASAVRKHSSLALCSAILDACTDVLWSAAAYCPDRSDFVALWRSIGEGFTVGKSAAEVIEQCGDIMPPEKYCVCLMVFLECGLLQSEDGSIYSAHPAVISGKADLEAAPTIKAIREFQKR